MIRLAELPLIETMSRIHWVDYPVVYLESWNTADLNEVPKGNVLLM